VERDELDTLDYLVRTNPAYAGRNLRQEALDYKARLGQYSRTWSEQHQGRVFDLEDDEHSEWIKQSHPEVDEEDLLSARAERRVEGRINARLQQQRYEEESGRVQREAETVAGQAGKDLIGFVNPQLAGKTLEEIEISDPYTAEVVEGLLTEATRRAKVAHTLFHPVAPVSYNEENADHVYAKGAVHEYEAELAAKPANQTRMQDGRSFSTLARWKSLPPSEQAKHWTLYKEPTVMRHLMLADLAGEATVRLEKVKKRFGGHVPAAASSAPAGNPPSSAAAGGVTTPVAGAVKPTELDMTHFFGG